MGVVEHRKPIHTNISIGFHIPELLQSRPQYGENTVFWMNLCGELCGWNLMKIWIYMLCHLLDSIS